LGSFPIQALWQIPRDAAFLFTPATKTCRWGENPDDHPGDEDLSLGAP
jgi:hypothetical protein